MRYRAKHRIGLTELTFFLIGMILLMLLATMAKGQQPIYKEYRGVRLGMTATEVRTKLGEPVMKSNQLDYFVISATETTQIAYDAFQKVVTISTDYSGGVGAPDYRSVVGDGMLLQKPDGSLFRMMQYDAAGMWVIYNKSATTVPVVTITIQMMR